MKPQDLRALSKDELKNKVEELQKQLMDLNFKRNSGVEKPHLFKQIRKDIARVLTLLKEKTKEA
ncbi:MAG: 50S ribosomal protein L29 [Candidatus Omnitrophica bacterium]|nr:50S ribosomal protein L29 [Candidatus Omnitrophota bacterium]